MNISKIFKITKVIVLNALFILIALFIIDYSLYLKCKHNYLKDVEHSELFPPITYIENYKADFSPNTIIFQNDGNNHLNYFRPISGKDYKNKNSILIFGCSFAYSAGLEDSQTISEKLSRYTKRTVYNFGINASGIQHMLHILKNKKLYNKIENKPEHIIYIYIPSHIERLRANIFPSPMMTNGMNLKYKIKNNKLTLDSSVLDIFSKTFIIKSIFYNIDILRNNGTLENKHYNEILATEIFKESRKIIKEKYPNIKYTIIRYEVEDDYGQNIEPNGLWKRLEEEGFNVIKSSDLIGRKYRYYSEDTNEDHLHPSEAAWDLLIPPLVKKLNL